MFERSSRLLFSCSKTRSLDVVPGKMFKHFINKVKEIRVWRFKGKSTTSFLRRFCEAIAPCRLHFSAVSAERRTRSWVWPCFAYTRFVWTSWLAWELLKVVLGVSRIWCEALFCVLPLLTARRDDSGPSTSKGAQTDFDVMQEKWKTISKGNLNVPFRYLRDLLDYYFFVSKGEVWMWFQTNV